MEEIIKLKNELLRISENEWSFPKDVDLDGLALEMMKNIGAIDPVLRDDLILTGFYNLVYEKKLSKKCLKQLLAMALSEEHLFYKLGTENDDSVFNRAFSILIVGIIIDYHNSFGEELIDEKEMSDIFNQIIKYVKNEKDLRGYVDVKGWAHAIAHSGDALTELGACNYLNDMELMEILDLIKLKCSIHNYVYINEEPERLVTAIVKILDRKKLSNEEVKDWIVRFKDIELPANFPDKQYSKVNIKNLLRSLYFRLKFKGGYDNLVSEIEAVLHYYNTNYNEFSE
ncbi:DUF2785 domain-containing protein [Alkaliphilus pronyensis]|uniref:DUF2785 domain-containing protein n=1 Tax=Alkaliphilus pronyensis TaxID=1482732 RepID=A0A6I0F5E3_9FIRM|nr:DUF2785 domain-containing protein [Alkaliphilus pronyensis]KAB3531306.1 DUF2785 domain-containing protein [Alkaliphilus pronyensis]